MEETWVKGKCRSRSDGSQGKSTSRDTETNRTYVTSVKLGRRPNVDVDFIYFLLAQLKDETQTTENLSCLKETHQMKFFDR